MPNFNRPVKAFTNPGQTAFAENTLIRADEVNADIDTLYNAINGQLDDDNIAPSAGIQYSKLTLTGGIVDNDISGVANIAGTKLAPGTVGATQLGTNAVTTAKILNEAVTTAKMSGSQTAVALVPTLREFQSVKYATEVQINSNKDGTWYDVKTEDDASFPTITGFDVPGDGADGNGYVVSGIHTFATFGGLAISETDNVWLRMKLDDGGGGVYYPWVQPILRVVYGGAGVTGGQAPVSVIAIAPIGSLAGQIPIETYTVTIERAWNGTGATSGPFFGPHDAVPGADTELWEPTTFWVGILAIG
jgi:hypothetical protein